MLHNIVQKKKILSPTEDDVNTQSNTFVQPHLRNMGNIIHSATDSSKRGETIRNTLLEITNTLPIRQQIHLIRK